MQLYCRRRQRATICWNEIVFEEILFEIICLQEDTSTQRSTAHLESIGPRNNAAVYCTGITTRCPTPRSEWISGVSPAIAAAQRTRQSWRRDVIVSRFRSYHSKAPCPPSLRVLRVLPALARAHEAWQWEAQLRLGRLGIVFRVHVIHPLRLQRDAVRTASMSATARHGCRCNELRVLARVVSVTKS